MEISENPFSNNLGKYLPVGSTLKFDQLNWFWDTLQSLLLGTIGYQRIILLFAYQEHFSLFLNRKATSRIRGTS